MTNASQPRWQELKALIEQTVQLEPTPIQLGARELTWYRVANPDTLLETAVAGSVDEAGKPLPAEELDPFWAATWRAALGLDQFLARLDLSGTRVLELGCGSGQAGVGAALRGASVTMTDAVLLALQVAELNAQSVASHVRFERLKWGVQLLPEPRFPIIIGSDLVYDTSLFEVLDECLRQHLAPQGRVYLSEPHRHTGDSFAKWIRQAGWETQEHDLDMQDGRIPVRVFECVLPL